MLIATMIYKRRRILSVLAVALMVMTWALPPGFHLKFCFGEDGHQKVLAIPCAAGQQALLLSSTNTNSDDHPQEGNDCTTACEEKKGLNSAFLSFTQNDSSEKFQFIPAAEAPGIISLSAHTPSAFPSSSGPYPARLTSLRTVVLLI